MLSRVELSLQVPSVTQPPRVTLATTPTTPMAVSSQTTSWSKMPPQPKLMQPSVVSPPPPGTSALLSCIFRITQMFYAFSATATAAADNSAATCDPRASFRK